MSEELMPCPVCGASVLPTFVGLHASTVSCFKGDCLYRVQAEAHNALARRAEVGRLVEEIVAAEKPDTTFILNVKWVHEGRETLLDALRSLAKEIA